MDQRHLFAYSDDHHSGWLCRRFSGRSPAGETGTRHWLQADPDWQPTVRFIFLFGFDLARRLTAALAATDTRRGCAGPALPHAGGNVDLPLVSVGRVAVFPQPARLVRQLVRRWGSNIFICFHFI